jgi:exonuclease SbcC
LEQQTQLEQQQTTIVEKLNQLQALKPEQQNISRQLIRIQAEQTKLAAEIERIQALKSQTSQIPELEHKRDRLQEQLSRVEAAKQFEAELRQLVSHGEDQRDFQQAEAEKALAIMREVQQMVPLLATASVESALVAIQSGVQLNTNLLNRLWRILADLSEQISVPKLQEQLHQTRTALDVLYQQRAELSTLNLKLAQQSHWQEEINQLQERLTQVKEGLSAEAEWLQARSRLVTELNQLGNPKGRIQLLERDLQQSQSLNAQHSALSAKYTALEQAIAALDAQLTQFNDLEEQMEYQKDLRQAHQSFYVIYMQHRNDANQLSKLQAEFTAAVDQLEQLTVAQTVSQTEYEQIAQTYDPQQWQQIQADYQEKRSEFDRVAGGLPQQRKLLAELDSQLSNLEAVAQKRDQTQLDLKQKEKIRKFISFARKVYKEAGPRITERYVQTISREADRLFRELLNRPNVALEWTRDYEILIQEGAHSRRFINLSGGEQMCAALAVRLALLRVLADIDIAFFDEPTTNMDRPRRESLADAIANIKSFRQLFVISHDDTFEKVTENVILVEREPG